MDQFNSKTQHPSSAASGRLTGWKEIANYLGRSVRSAQRWEQELSMPVHRRHALGGEIVYALRAELDAWFAASEVTSLAMCADGPEAAQSPESQPNGTALLSEAAANPMPDAPPAELQHPVSLSQSWPRLLAHRWAHGMIGAVLFLGAAWAAIAFWAGKQANSTELPPAQRERAVEQAQPAWWVVENNQLKTFDSKGQLLWLKLFEAALTEAFYDRKSLLPGQQMESRVKIEDLDGDGSQEVLIHVLTEKPELRSFTVFDANGKARFTSKIGRSIHFGGKGVSAAVPHRPFPDHLGCQWRKAHLDRMET